MALILDLPTMSPLLMGNPFKPRPHQLNAIMRYITDGSLLAAHGVGSGKTFTLCGCAVEGQTFGCASKTADGRAQ